MTTTISTLHNLLMDDVKPMERSMILQIARIGTSFATITSIG